MATATTSLAITAQQQAQQLARFSPKQRYFLQVMMTAAEAIVCAQGAIRSGKTHASIFGFLVWALSLFADCNFIIAGQSLASVGRNVRRPMIGMLIRMGIPYIWREQKAELVIGKAVFLFVGAHSEQAQDRIQGMTVAGALLDESVLLPKSFIMQVLARLTFDGSKLFCTYNPDSPHHWFKKEIVDGMLPAVVKFGLQDNPVLSEEAKQRYRTMFTGVFYERFVLGNWAAAEGAIFPDFNTFHAADLPGTSPSYVDVTLDYASASVTAGLLVASFADIDYVIGEYYHDARTQGALTDRQIVDNLKAELFNEQPPNRFWVDPAAASIKVILRRDNLPVRDANNNVLSGIRCVSTQFAAKKLFISDACPNLISELGGYRWDAKKQEDGDDAPVKVNDHGCDALRYYIYSRRGRMVGKVQPKPKGY